MDAPVKVGVIASATWPVPRREIRPPEGHGTGRVADLSEAGPRGGASAWGQGFTDYRELLPEVAAVSVAVPTSGHFDVVQEALAAGCHVLVEKPISVTVAEADEMVRLARERRRILMVGHLERFNSAMEEIKAKVNRPRFIESPAWRFLRSAAPTWTWSWT